MENDFTTNENYNGGFEKNDQPPIRPVCKRSPCIAADKKDSAFVAVFFALSVLMSWLLLYGSFYLGFTIANVVFLLVMTAYCRGSGGGAKNKTFPVVCGVLALITGILPSIADHFGLNFTAVAATVVLDAAYIDGMWGRSRYGFRDIRIVSDLFNRIFVRTLLGLLLPFRSILHAGTGKSKKMGKIILGLCISVPTVILLCSILIKSDAAFEGVIKQIFYNPTEVIGVVVYGLLLFPFLLSFAFCARKNLNGQPREVAEKRFLDPTVVNTVLCAVSVLYMIYLLSQLSYFMSAFSGILPAHFTYAEYARRGFFELCAIAAINLFFIFLSAALTKRTDGKRDTLNKVLSLFICLFTLLIISTAEAKIVLYIRQYGMTVNRILPACFLILLAVCFLCAVIRIFSESFPYIKVLILCGVAMLVALTVVNPDRLTARYNIKRYEEGTLKSLSGIEELSSGATEEIYKLLDSSDPAAQAVAKSILSDKIDTYFNHVYDKDENVYRYERSHLLSKISEYNSSVRKEIRCVGDYIEKYAEEIEGVNDADNVPLKSFTIETIADFEYRDIQLDYTFESDGRVVREGTVGSTHADGSLIAPKESVYFLFDKECEGVPDGCNVHIKCTVTLGNAEKIMDTDEFYVKRNNLIHLSLSRDDGFFSVYAF